MKGFNANSPFAATLSLCLALGLSTAIAQDAVSSTPSSQGDEPEPSPTAVSDTGGTMEQEPSVSQLAIDTISTATTRYLPVVFFNHDAHGSDLGIACGTCHHDLVKTMNGTPSPCSACHDNAAATVNLAAAMHGSCRACHLERPADHPDSQPPVDCLSCHTERGKDREG